MARPGKMPDFDQRIAFARFLRDARENKGWTQDETARKLGDVAYNTYTNWEGGRALPDFGMFLKLCEVFGWNHPMLVENARWFQRAS